MYPTFDCSALLCAIMDISKPANGRPREDLSLDEERGPQAGCAAAPPTPAVWVAAYTRSVGLSLNALQNAQRCRETALEPRLSSGIKRQGNAVKKTIW
jgi:hypothetical protein